MDILAQDGKNKVHTLSIKEYEKIDNFIVYKIEINAQDCNWVVLRRYREFHRLHEELVNTFGIAWELLPPKKLVGNLKTDHIEKRKGLLEKYLKSVLQILDEYPRVLIEFLELDQFDVHAVCQQLASDLYEIGDDLLAKGYIFKITPLQIHCINRRLQLPLPTCEGDNPNEDIGHLYSFIQQVPRIMVHPGEELHLFIGQNDLKYDLTVFKSLKYLEIQMCDIELIQGIAHIQANVSEICVHRSLKLLKDFLIGGDNWTQGILMPVNSGKEEVDSVVNQCQPWAQLRRASFSYNDFHSIDFTITLLPNITYLDLSHNLLTEVQYLEELTFLTELNLSYNEIRDLTEFPFRLPSVSKLNVAGNGIRNIAGLDKMYCLEELDLSNNCIETVTAILPLGNLPMLHSLHVKGNSLAEFGNHRVRIFSQFEQRASEMLLDNNPPTKREMAKITDMLASQDSFCVIPDDPFPQKPKEKKPVSQNCASTMKPNMNEQNSCCPSVKAKDDLEADLSQVDTVKQTDVLEKKLSSSEIPQSSPQGKKRDRIAVIKSHQEASSDACQPSVEDDGKFREQVEKLREQAGESWLTFFNDLVEEEEGKVNSASYGSDELVADEEESEKQAAKDNEVHKEGSMPQTIEDNDEIKEMLCEASQETDVTKCNVIGESQDGECKKEDEKEANENCCTGEVIDDIKDIEHVKDPPFILSVDQIDVETPDDLKDVIRQLIEEDIDLNKETFLMVDKDGFEEYMMTKDGQLLIRVELSSGLPVGSYDLESASDLSVNEDDGKYCLQFMTKTDGNGSESGLNELTISLFSKNVKDAAGLYILIKSFIENRISSFS